jgi:inhibitor of KinA sporulation pathway (predicted exonuclease)
LIFAGAGGILNYVSGRDDQAPGRTIVLDLEATCWEGRVPVERMEIIEIGAVALAGSTLEPAGEFSRFVRPFAQRVLSEFCTRLTSIRQDQVDSARIFREVFPEFLAWIGPEPGRVCSWGAYDLNQLRVDCRRHGLELPESLAAAHLNLKTLFQERRSLRRGCGLAQALRLLGWPLEGTHHRGIDDARNISRIARLLLAEPARP